MEKIQMVDLNNQYLRLKPEIDSAIQQCIDDSRFIGGKPVRDFESDLAEYLSVNHVINCANGTDALQLALMALNLRPGDEVIVPAFTYAATAEVIGLLGFNPVMVEVHKHDYNIDVRNLEKAITHKTRVVIPVHLFGQCSDMDLILDICNSKGIHVVEDNAQSIGADFLGNDGPKKAGTIGDIGCISFFPSKTLGCYGDGGCLCTNDERLATKIRQIANHGQAQKYFHEVIGLNSRLDSIQAAILSVKLKYLDDFIERRNKVAAFYDNGLGNIPEIIIPARSSDSTHVFHQYTLKIKSNKRDKLKVFLADHNIPSMIYYPLPLYKQNAYKKYYHGKALPITEKLCEEVLSLPVHTEFQEEQLTYICSTIQKFFD